MWSRIWKKGYRISISWIPSCPKLLPSFPSPESYTKGTWTSTRYYEPPCSCYEPRMRIRNETSSVPVSLCPPRWSPDVQANTTTLLLQHTPPPSHQILYQIHHAPPHSHVARDGRRRSVLKRMREGIHRYGFILWGSPRCRMPPSLPPCLPPCRSLLPLPRLPISQRLRTRDPPASQSFTLLPTLHSTHDATMLCPTRAGSALPPPSHPHTVSPPCYATTPRFAPLPPRTAPILRPPHYRWVLSVC